jgi:hypothetical protein
MKKVSIILLCVFCASVTVRSQDITKLEKIGPVESFTRSEKAVIFLKFG